MAVDQTDETGELGAVRRSVVLPARAETVWAALTEAGHLSAWLGGDVELDPFPGGQIVVREDGRLRRGVIVDVEPPRHLEIRWLPVSRRVGFLWGPDEEPAGDDRRGDVAAAQGSALDAYVALYSAVLSESGSPRESARTGRGLELVARTDEPSIGASAPASAADRQPAA